MAVTMRPAMDLLQTAQRRAGEDFVRTWTLAPNLSGLEGSSWVEDGFEGTLIEGTLIEGALIDGALIEGTLIEGTLMEGAAGEGSGCEIERSSTLGR